MTEDEYMALARQKYQDLQQLKTQPAFYDYEKTFDAIWQDLGRQVLEKSLSDVPADRRKKKIITRYGKIQIANSKSFSRHLNGFGISPYLQEKLVFLGQLEVYDQAAQNPVGTLYRVESNLPANQPLWNGYRSGFRSACGHRLTAYRHRLCAG
ncbi:MAG: hypothetical protein LH606_15395 [Cytophagaceae bacterium]|nr:hypothetical protein [Cytophagaceae bacterium]